MLEAMWHCLGASRIELRDRRCPGWCHAEFTKQEIDETGDDVPLRCGSGVEIYLMKAFLGKGLEAVAMVAVISASRGTAWLARGVRSIAH